MRALTRDPMVLQYVKGFKIPFCKPVTQNIEPSSIRFNPIEIEHLNSEITKLLESGAIVECCDLPSQFISSIFLTPKSDGTYRFILNLKSLNKFIQPQHFKMEDIRTAMKLIQKNCYMGTIDMKEAYYSVPIDKSYRKYLRFKFQNHTYEFQCLPFGLSLAPFVFTKLLKPIVSYLRSRGFLLVIYLDDILCIGYSYEDCLNCISETVTLLESLGFVINYSKSKLIPNQTRTFLGFELDSREMHLKLPQKKITKIFESVQKLSNKTTISIRDFARFLGLLCSACPAVPYGWVYTKRFEREKFLGLQNAADDYDKIMTLSPLLEPDFTWWKTHINHASNPIRNGQYFLEIFSDASMTGWGIACNGERASGFWDAIEAKNHINFLELKAAFIGLMCFATNFTNKEILLRIDNTTAISYINRYGGIQYPHLNDIAREIWQWCEHRQLHIFASYIKSKENREADKESRRTNIDTEWSLSSSAFKIITDSFGHPHIDLFASRLNAKCRNYVSWRRDPHALNIDAFTLDWSKSFFYSFPPFSLILKCLRKIMTDKACGIMVVPLWPSQPWYPLFVALSQNEIIYLKPEAELLVSPSREQHPMWKSLTLVASLLSGELSKDSC